VKLAELKERRPVAGVGRRPTPSFWLDQVEARPTRPELSGAIEADVCIVGGGFTGLWMAYELKRAEPRLGVVVLEAEHVGFGASGRNGGWVIGKIAGPAHAWRRHGGPGAPLAMARAIEATVAEIGTVVAREGIECDWHQGGTLMVAQSPLQLARLRADVAAEREALGEDGSWQLISASELSERVAVSRAQGALYSPYCARVQPAKLVMGLAAAAERLGVAVYESSRVVSVQPGLVAVARGSVAARHVLVATECYTANLPGRRRRLLPLNSSMIVTAPLSPEVWSRVGWSGSETLLDGAHVYTYSQRTADGRIAIGGRGVPYRFGSRTDREGPVPAQTVSELRARLAALFPELRDVQVDRAWHGVLGVSRDWCPLVSFDPVSGIGFAGGYAGDGVAASNLAGRTMRDLVLGRDSELVRLPWVGAGARAWEPEPLRFVGARTVYGLYRRADQREERTGRPSGLATLASRIAGR